MVITAFDSSIPRTLDGASSVQTLAGTRVTGVQPGRYPNDMGHIRVVGIKNVVQVDVREI